MKRRFLIFIGMVFLLSTSALAQPFETTLPLQFNTGDKNDGLPSTVITIQNKQIPIILDTGTIDTDIALSREALEGTQVYFTGKDSCYRSLNRYSCQQHFIVPRAQLGGFIVKNIRGMLMEKFWGSNNRHFKETQASHDGAIGLSLLSQFNLLLDYSHHKMVLVKQGHFPAGYDVKNWTRVPFVNRDGIVTYAKINGKLVTLLWDTGSVPSKIKQYFNFMRDSRVCNKKINYAISNCRYVVANHFSITRQALSPTWFLLDHIPSNIPFDGLIGSNFYEENLVFFDFKNHLIYVKGY